MSNPPYVDASMRTQVYNILKETDYIKEYIINLGYGNIGTPFTLPKTIDDLERNLRADIYDQMLLDSQVRSCLGIAIAGILGGGIKILPASDPGTPDYDTNVEVAKFVEQALFEGLDDQDFISILWRQIYDSMSKGHSIAEKVVWDIDESPIPGKMIFNRINVKSKRATNFVVDCFGNVLGITSYTSFVTITPFAVLPKDKFAIFSWEMVDNDPRGSSILRTPYIWWWAKQQVMPEQIKYLAQFGTPSIKGTAPEGAAKRARVDNKGVQQVDSSGNAIIDDPVAKLLAQLIAFQNSSIIALPFGADAEIMQPSGDGEVILKNMKFFDDNIAKGILYVTGASEETTMSGTATTTHENTLLNSLDMRILVWEEMIRRQYAKQLVKWNYPPGTKIPKVKLPGAKRSEFLAWASAISKLDWFFDPSQFPGLDSMLNVPARSVQGLTEAIEAKTKERENASLPPQTTDVQTRVKSD